MRHRRLKENTAKYRRNFNMRNNGKSCQIARPLLFSKMFGYAVENFNFIKFKMADLRPLLTLTLSMRLPDYSRDP